MMSGKIKDALCLLSVNVDGQVFPFNSDVMDLLVRYHLKKKLPVSSTLVDGIADTPHFILFDQLDAVRMRCVTLKFHGAAGPSGQYASALIRMCTFLKHFMMICVMHSLLLPVAYVLLSLILVVYPLLLPVD